jgi:hypothetical protein
MISVIASDKRVINNALNQGRYWANLHQNKFQETQTIRISYRSSGYHRSSYQRSL